MSSTEVVSYDCLNVVYHTEVSTAAPTSSRVLQIKATDRDSGSFGTVSSMQPVLMHNVVHITILIV